MNILITGVAGFIGYHLAVKIMNKSKSEIFGIDNVNNYYDTKLKLDRLSLLKKNKNFNFKKIDINNFEKLNNYIKANKIKIIINLAAQAGVRHSIKNPKDYFQSNILGFFNILEVSRLNNIKHLIFASTSSVYGDSKKFPLKENYPTDSPLTFYAASKKTNEVMAYSYSNIYNLPCTGLRFFTVYGEMGRPDMALFKFVKSILKNQSINLHNYGNHQRDFTYVDDVTEAIYLMLKKPSKKTIPFDIFNVGSNNPSSLKKFVSILESELGTKSKIKLLPLQIGDVVKTHASIAKICSKINFKPNKSINFGINNFVKWYLNYYK